MSLKSGWGKAEIIPPLGYPLAGYVRRTSVGTGVLDPLFVRAFVFGSGRRRMAIVTADILLISNRWAARLRRNVARILNIWESHVVIAATHTHSGPTIDMAPFDFSPPGSKSPPSGYVSKVERGISYAVRQAAEHCSPTNVSFARILVHGVATDRDRPQQFRSQPLYLFRFESDSAAAVLGIYGCHSTVLGYSNSRFSGDLLGALVRQLESQVQFAAFGCGAAANISTRFTRRAQSPQELSRLTKLAAVQMKRARFQPLDIASIRVREKNVFLPFRNLDKVPSVRAKGKGRLGEATAEALENLQRLRLAKDFRLDGARIAMTQIELGGVSLLTIPLEIGLSTGEFFWKQASAVPFCYANGYWGYMPPANSRAADYEIISSAFPREADQQLREAGLAFLHGD